MPRGAVVLDVVLLRADARQTCDGERAVVAPAFHARRGRRRAVDAPLLERLEVLRQDVRGGLGGPKIDAPRTRPVPSSMFQ